MADVVTKAKALESANTANKLITDSSKSTTEERVHWVKKEMKLRREPGTCHWCGDKRGPHPWRQCPAQGKTCSKCGINDYFANGQPPQRRGGSMPPSTRNNRTGPPAKHPVTAAAVHVGKMCITCNLVETNPPTTWCMQIIITSNVTL